MFETFSESSRKIIFLARYEAGRLKYDYIDTPHFLLGFIAEDGGDSERQMRKSLGMEDLPAGEQPRQKEKESFLGRETAERLQAALSVFGPRDEPQPTHGDMPLTEGAKSVLKAAFEHANGSQVTPLHLLWAMFVDRESPVAKALRENGITREQVENEIHRRSSA